MRRFLQPLIASSIAASTPLKGSWIRTNYAGNTVSLAGGLGATIGAGLAALGAEGRPAVAGMVATTGGAIAGYLDDHQEEDSSIKGLQGHLGALQNGTVTTGALKIMIIGGSAAVAALALPHKTSIGDWMTRTVAIAGTANLVNLLDLRPGRALKATGVLAGLAALPYPGSAPSQRIATGLAGTIIGIFNDDAQGRTMTGDLGANALGACVGTALAAHPSATVRRLTALGATALIVASEKISFSSVIESNPVLSAIDRYGRE